MVDLELKFPKDFFIEENRDGFTVTKERKEIWAVELDLLAKLDRVCKKHNLKYSLEGGTLLGAVRHKGFIPWDDDIDVIMLRKDYDELCKIACNEFKGYYFFQTEYTDPNSFRRHAQLRNSNTTGILKVEKPFHLPFNQGIFIDIFPLDNIIDDKKKLSDQMKKMRRVFKEFSIYKEYNLCYSKPKSKLKTVIKNLVKKLYNGPFKRKNNYQYALKKYIEFEKLCAMYNGIFTKNVSLLSFYHGECVLGCHNINGWNSLIETRFEFLKFPIISNYDTYLRSLYGDNYMTPIQADSAHGGVIFDTNKSYKEYLKADKN